MDHTHKLAVALFELLRVSNDYSAAMKKIGRGHHELGPDAPTESTAGAAIRALHEAGYDYHPDATEIRARARSASRNVYQDAIDAQGACNLGALVHGFDRVINTLQAEAHANGKGTEWLNKHPAVVLFVEQLHYLSGHSGAYSAAYAECETKAREGTGVAEGPRKGLTGRLMD